jgi:hypothetical protein
METATSDPRPAELPPLSVDEGSIGKLASCGGHGTLEILKVTQDLENNSIPCCLVGTSALIYYGANRIRGVS